MVTPVTQTQKTKEQAEKDIAAGFNAGAYVNNVSNNKDGTISSFHTRPR